MKVTEISGVVEKNGILVSKGCQVIAVISSGIDFVTEEMEIELVDLINGKSTPLIRSELIITLAEVCAQGGNLRTQSTALIEVSDGRDLELNANKMLRINLKGLTQANLYSIYAIESGIPNGIPVVWEQLFIANGVKNQRFPISDGSLLVLPKTDLSDIRIVYNDNTECRLDTIELTQKAKATNGIIEVNNNELITKVGSNKVFIIDLNLVLTNGQTKKVSEIELRLLAGNGYTLYKISNLENPGFDWRF